MRDILKLARIQILIILLFAAFKSSRHMVLESGAPQWLKTTFLSLPNFFEGVLGPLILTGMGLYLNLKYLSEKKRLKNNLLYILATVLAAIYVLTQEFKIHNLGGNNVFDWNDVLFSLVGLTTGYILLLILKPSKDKKTEF